MTAVARVRTLAALVAGLKATDGDSVEVTDNAGRPLARILNNRAHTELGIAVSPGRLIVELHEPLLEPLRTLLLAAPIAIRLNP